MTILEAQQAVCTMLANDQWFLRHNIEPLAEDAGNVDAEADRALAEVGLSVAVTTPDIVYAGDNPDGTLRCEIGRMEIACGESPATRIELDHPSALDAAIAAARALHDPSNGIIFEGITQGLQDRTVIATATFSTAITIGE